MNKSLCLFLILLTAAAGLFALPVRENSQKTGELRFGVMSEPSTLDPLNPSNTADGRSILFNVYEGLVKPDTTGRLLPAAAESVEISNDALVYTFVLRSGLRFHNGSPVTSGDVLFSLNQAKSANFTGLSGIDKIEAAGNKIIITLKSPNPEFLPYLTVAIVPMNNSDRERNPTGTGPFMIQEYSQQQHLILVKNPHYWQQGIPRLEKVTVVFTGDSSALYTGLEGGNFDGARVAGDIVEMLDKNKYSIFESYSNSVQMMALNNFAKPFDDIRVRTAINYAVNKREIIETAFYGHGELSGSPLIPGLKIFYNEALRDPYPADSAKARALLAQAGYPNGFDMEIKVPSNYVMHVDTAQVLVNQLAEINVRATIRLVDWATWLSDVYAARNYQATIISLDGATVSPQSYLSRYASTSGSNFINFRSDEFDRIYARILAETNEAERIRLYREAQKIISDQAPAVYIQDIFAFNVYRGRVSGVVGYPLYVIDFSTLYNE